MTEYCMDMKCPHQVLGQWHYKHLSQQEYQDLPFFKQLNMIDELFPDREHVWEWKELCPKDHMHTWERSQITTNLICTTEPDEPHNVDADMAAVIESIEWVSVTFPIKFPTFTELIEQTYKDLNREHSDMDAAQPTTPSHDGESKATNE